MQAVGEIRYNTALGAYNYLENADRIKVIKVDNLRGIRIRELFEKYKTLSLTDCSLVSIAEDFNIKYLFSFDKLFDKVKGIKRLEEFDE